MNTTWIISPNWLAWGLLILAVAALWVIALRVGKERTSQHDTQQNQNFARNRHGWVAWAAIVLAVISIISCLFRSPTPNDASMLIAALGVMVTLLVTWNIWQTIDTRSAIQDVVVLRTQFEELRNEIDVLHGIHEAYVLDALGEDNRRAGNSHRGFDYFLRSAFIFARDLEHYDLRFMSEINSMRTCFDDLFRSIPNREREISQFNFRTKQIVRDLENLRQQANNLQRFSEQAQRELNILINNITALSNTPSTPEH